MALTFTNVATAITTSSSTTLTASSLTISTGQWVVVAVAGDVIAGTSLTTVTDSVGNTYQRLFIETQNPNFALGTTLGIYLAKINTALSSGSITANFNTNLVAKAMSIKRIEVAEGETLSVVAVGAGVEGTATGTFSAGSVSVTSGHTIYGATAVETSASITADSDTTNGSWSTAHSAVATGGNDDASQSISTQQKTVTATGNQTYNTSTGINNTYVINYVIFAPSVLGYWAINGVTQ